MEIVKEKEKSKRNLNVSNLKKLFKFCCISMGLFAGSYLFGVLSHITVNFWMGTIAIWLFSHLLLLCIWGAYMMITDYIFEE